MVIVEYRSTDNVAAHWVDGYLPTTLNLGDVYRKTFSSQRSGALISKCLAAGEETDLWHEVLRAKLDGLRAEEEDTLLLDCLSIQYPGSIVDAMVPPEVTKELQRGSLATYRHLVVIWRSSPWERRRSRESLHGLLEATGFHVRPEVSYQHHEAFGAYVTRLLDEVSGYYATPGRRASERLQLRGFRSRLL